MNIQSLLSLPPGMAGQIGELAPGVAAEWFAASDPVGLKLGSGGGTAFLLREAWRRTGAGASFGDWLRASRKLIVHAGGQSRRLPAYAATGKAFIPVPVMRWAVGQRLEQTLLDLQAAFYRDILARAAAQSVVMVTSGDVLLRSRGAWPKLPAVDILVVGLWVRPEQARQIGRAHV